MDRIKKIALDTLIQWFELENTKPKIGPSKKMVANLMDSQARPLRLDQSPTLLRERLTTINVSLINC